MKILNRIVNLIENSRANLKSLALAVAVGVGLGAGSAQAAITFDAASSASQGGGLSTIAWSHTVGGGADAMLVVGVTTESNPDRTVTGVTFGLQALAQVPLARAFNGATTANASDLWYLKAPTAGTATITVTFSGSVGNGTVAGAVSMFGVVQGPPEAVANYNAGNGSTYSAAITTLTYGSWLVDAVNNGTVGASLTPTSGQTRRWYNGGANHAGAGGTREVTPAGLTTDTWTTSGTSRRALSVASFAPVTPPLPANAGTSTVTAAPLSVPDDGATTSTVTATIKDAGGNPTPGKSVTLTSDRGTTDTIAPAVGFTDDAGVATFTVKSTTLGAAVLTAHVANDIVDVTQPATVTFVNSPACDLLAFGPGAVINQGAQTILWTVGVGTDPATLRPTYTASIHATGLPASGADPGFSGTPPTATYTITAQDGSTTKDYAVTVAFSPMPVWGGLACWYDASDGANPSGGGTITSWNDLSGNGHTATPSGSPVLALNQLNSKPAVQFRGNHLNCAGTFFAKEQYVVLRSPTPAWSGYGAFLGRATGRGSSYMLDPNNAAYTGFWADQAPLAVSMNGTAVPIAANGNHIFSLGPLGIIQNFMILKIVVNNNDPSAAAYRIADADGNQLPCDIAEIIAYDTTLSSADEAKVGSYLADKYAITTAYPLISVPVAPTGLTATPLSSAIQLNWTAAWSATDYNVYRGTAPGVHDPTPLSNTGGATTYTDLAVTNGTKYYYVVRALNIIGEGASSAEVFEIPLTGKADQTITFGPLASKTYGDAPFELTATTIPLLPPRPVSYASSDESVASVVGSTVTIHKAGTTAITASRDADEAFNAATSVTQDLTVSMASQTLTFTLGSRLVRGTSDPAFGDLATTTGASGNPVMYSSTNEAVATVDSSGMVSLVGVGTTEIRADQDGTAEYHSAAPQVSQTLIVIPAGLLPVTSGLACWYDAGQGVTTDGSGVSSWADSSTLGHLATRASGSPTLVPNDVNGRPAVHLRGSSTWFNCAGGMFTKEQYLVVRSPNATWNGSGSFLGRKSDDFLAVRASSYNMAAGTTGFWEDHFPSAVSRNGTPLSQNYNQPDRCGYRLVPITEYMVLKITVDSQASAANLAQYPYYQIGKNETLGTMDFDVAEIVGYDRALSPAEEVSMTAYLTGKYLATTYTDWAATHGIPGEPATGDYDGDGMSNQQEYAFGLDPTSGASVNPIAVPFVKATGMFSYTRTVNTGLTYKVWHSTDLENWDSTLTTQGPATPNGGGVETVPVTLDPSLLAELQLFLKVTAE
ncbi:MAG: Ig-like domain-containing protein [Verrucomicrobia bacterium]|nr:Ig-like domain-containing protein [Verrucomicrobiota bacterium]